MIQNSLEKSEQNWDNSPLVTLIESGIDSDEKVELFKELIENGASLDLRSTPLNWNLLHYLVMAPQMRAEIKKANSFEKKVIEAIAEKQPSLVDEKDSTGYTLIAYAVENKEADVARILASKGANLDAPIYSITNQVETLVDIALKNFDKDVLPVLLNQEQEKVYKAADAVFKRIISEKNSKKYKETLTLLREENKLGFYQAMHQNKMAIINIAIERNDFAFLENALVGSDIGPLNYFTKEQFDKAKENKDPTNTIVKKIDEFYSKYQDDKNWVNRSQSYFVYIILDNIDGFKLLIEKGVDIGNVKNKDGNTPLHESASYGKTEVINTILEAAGDRKFELLFMQDKYGNTPLHEAALYGKTEAIKAILDAAGDRKFELLFMQDKYGNTPLHEAARGGKAEAIKAILDAAGDRKFELLSMQDNLGNTPLHKAALLGQTEAIKAILDAAGDRKFELLSKTNSTGFFDLNNKTPMHFFTDKMFEEVFSLQGVNKEVLGAIKSHLSYYGVEESFFGNLSRTFNKACAIIPAIYGEDISANVTFQNEVDSVLDKIKHDLRANSRTNEGIAR